MGSQRLALLALLAFVADGCVGWQSFRCPETVESGPAIDAATAAALKKIRVGVRQAPHGRAPTTLANCLRRTGLFGDVVEMPTDAKVDLAATISMESASVTPIPILPALTLGFLPQWLGCEAGFVIRISSLPRAPSLLEFDCRYHTVLVWGWPSMLLTPFAGFANTWFGEMEETEDFADFVKVKLSKKAKDLADLARPEDQAGQSVERPLRRTRRENVERGPRG